MRLEDFHLTLSFIRLLTLEFVLLLITILEFVMSHTDTIIVSNTFSINKIIKKLKQCD